MCLDDDQILLLLEGKLPEGARAEVEEHLDSCEACRRLVGAAAPTYDKRGGSAALAETVPSGAADLSASAPEHAATGVLGRGASVGRYLVLSLLGKGGMGNVYAAYDPELDRRVALKLLHPATGSEGARRLLEREARALGKLSHPNVVQVHDVGEHEGDVFVAMELVEGESLDVWCVRSPRPGFQEVLRAYLDAARGLSSAHAKGLVHRDVKPSNILCGNDGRVCVADFGLAASREGERYEGPESDVAPAAASLRDERLTATGAVLGTPLYMAPEQHEGLRATAASDQYSLCVALYAGLYGAPPFARGPGLALKEVLGHLLAAKKAGPPASPPAGSAVPGWIHKALGRGLALDPNDRYPSMDALIAALSDDPEARRRARWRRAGAGVAAALLLAVAAGGWAKSGVFHDPCAHPERQLEGVWDEGVKSRMRAAFLGTGRSYAESTVTRVVALLERYAGSYGAMWREVCVASGADGHRREILGLRDACLDRRRGQLQALTTLFSEKPDPEVLDKAVAAAAGLSPITYCADTEALTARVRPPEDPALRARVAELQPRVDRLEALYTAGKYKDGVALGEPLLAETAALPYPPLRAQVQYWVGKLRDWTGDYAGARASLREAALSAAEGKDDVLVANAWAYLLFVVAERQQHFEEATLIESLGFTVVVRAQDEPSRANWMNSAGLMFNNAGKLAEAKEMYERVLSIRERGPAPDHPDVAATLNNLGNVLRDLGDYPRALAAYQRGLAIEEKALGQDHPGVANLLYNLGDLLDVTGNYPLAFRMHQRALSIKETALGPDHPSVAPSLVNLALVLFHLGEYARALPMYERALVIKERTLRPDSPGVAYALSGLGRVHVRLGHLDAALPLLERARAALEKAQGLASREAAEPILGLGELSLARREPEQALPLLDHALALDNAEYVSEIQLTLAEALWQVGKDRPRARALAEQARAAYERIGHAPGLDRATRWLSEHPGG